MGVAIHTASHPKGITAVAALAKPCYITEGFKHGNNKLSKTTIKSDD
jgi:hypothetical protein